MNPTIFVIPCKKIEWFYNFTTLQFQSLTKWSFIQITIIHVNISSQVGDNRRLGFGQRMNSSTIHDNICSHIYKKYHLKSYHKDIKYHMTVNIKFRCSYGEVDGYLLPLSSEQTEMAAWPIKKKTLDGSVYLLVPLWNWCPSIFNRKSSMKLSSHKMSDVSMSSKRGCLHHGPWSRQKDHLGLHQWAGRFLSITGWDPSVCNSNRLHVHIH